MLSSCILFPISEEVIIYESKSGLSTNPYIGLVNWIPLFMSFGDFNLFLTLRKKDKFVQFLYYVELSHYFLVATLNIF